MSTARETFARYAKALADGDNATAASYFTADGALEFPYWPLLGLTDRYQGHEALTAYLGKLLELVPGFAFTEVAVHIDTPEAMFAEFTVDLPTSTGRRFNFHYGNLVLTEGGKIKVLREFIDQVPAATALLPGGLSDVRV